MVNVILKSPFFIIAILLLSLTKSVLAEPSAVPKATEQTTVIGHVKYITGEASFNGEQLEQGSPINLGTVTTSAGSTITLSMIDDASVNLGENSQLAINQYRFQKKAADNSIRMKFVTGTLRVISGKVGKNESDTNKTKTPSTLLNIKGTDYQIDLKDDEESIQVKKGLVTLKEKKLFGAPKPIALGDKEKDCCVAISKPPEGKRGTPTWNVFSTANKPKDFPPSLEIAPVLQETTESVSQAERSQESLMTEWDKECKEELEKSLDEGELKNMRNSLLRLLSKKFTHMPDDIIKRIEQTNDLTHLQDWFDQAIMATRIEMIEFS